MAAKVNKKTHATSSAENYLSERSPSMKNVKTFEVTPPGLEASISKPAECRGLMWNI